MVDLNPINRSKYESLIYLANHNARSRNVNKLRILALLGKQINRMKPVKMYICFVVTKSFFEVCSLMDEASKPFVSRFLKVEASFRNL